MRAATSVLSLSAIVPVFLTGCGTTATTTTTTTSDDKYVNLQTQFQAVLNEYAAKYPTKAFQVGFKDANAHFGLVSGQFWKPGTDGYQPANLSDKFLYGSGTKPFTATAVMTLVEQGKLNLDDKLEDHVDSVLNQMENGTSMHGLFGKNGSKVTVGQVLQMRSCINDFDWPKFDQELLLPPDTYKIHTPLEIIKYVAGGCPLDVCEPFVCEPGSGVVYSSTNYVLAGLVLASFREDKDWSKLNIWDHYPPALKKNMTSAHFYNTEMINDVATLPGFASGGWGGYPNTTIWNQSATILGWTCGNLAATAADNAAFFWDLLSGSTILKEETVNAMKNVTPFTTGWAAGDRSYGTGLMMVQLGKQYGVPPTWGEWGSYIGHGGDTYGFLSEQGVVWGLDASLTVVANHDSPGLSGIYCRLINAAAKALKGVDTGLTCSTKFVTSEVAVV